MGLSIVLLDLLFIICMKKKRTSLRDKYNRFYLVRKLGMYITNVDVREYKKLIKIWESSVRATHDFLKEQDIQELKPLILNQYFHAVDLKCIKDEKNNMVGFSGVLNANLEMLFISAEARTKGFGKVLVEYAITHQKVHKVDVNEQNLQALEFYKHLGFRVVGRSELDGQGKEYPLLHLEL